VRLGRDDRLVAGAGVAAPHAVHLGRRAGADALQRAEPLLAGGGRGRCRAGEPLLFVEGHPRHELAFPVAERTHLVVEAGQGDPTLLVVERREQRGHRVQGVGDAAAERSRVQVHRRPAQRELDAGQAPHGHHGTGQVARGHAGVADDDDVAGEPLLAFLQQGGEVRGAGLLLALDQQLDRDGGGLAPHGGKVGADAEQVEGDVALVVDRAAGVQLGAVRALDDGRLEGRVHPKFGRVDRLHVVVPVDEGDRRVRVGAGPLGEDSRRARRLPDLHGREADTLQRAGQPGRAGDDVAGVRGVGGDRRDAQPGVEVGVQVVEVGTDEIALGTAHGHRR
jgi:hypothetical protein